MSSLFSVSKLLAKGRSKANKRDSAAPTRSSSSATVKKDKERSSTATTPATTSVIAELPPTRPATPKPTPSPSPDFESVSEKGHPSPPSTPGQSGEIIPQANDTPKAELVEEPGYAVVAQPEPQTPEVEVRRDEKEKAGSVEEPGFTVLQTKATVSEVEWTALEASSEKDVEEKEAELDTPGDKVDARFEIPWLEEAQPIKGEPVPLLPSELMARSTDRAKEVEDALRVAQEELQARTATVEELRVEVKKLSVHVETLETEKEVVKVGAGREKQGLAEEIQRLKGIIEVERLDSRERIAVLEKEKSEKSEKLERINKDLREEVQRLKGIISVERLDSRERLAVLEKEHNEKSETIRRLEQRFEDQRKGGAEVYAKNREVEVKNREMEAKNREVETKNRGLETRNRELEAKNRELEAKNRELETNDGELEARNRELEAKNLELEVKNRELEVKNRELEAKHRQRQAKDDELEAKLRQRGDGSEGEDEEVVDKESHIRMLEMNNDNLASQLVHVQTTVTATERENRMLLDQIRQQSNELQSLKGGTLFSSTIFTRGLTNTTRDSRVDSAVSIVKTLNEEIFHLAASMTDRLENTPKRFVLADGAAPAMTEVLKSMLGLELVKTLQEDAPQASEEGSPFIQMALQGCLIACCMRIITSWYPAEWDYGNFLVALYERIRGTGGPVLALHWRKATQQSCFPSTDRNTKLVAYLTEQIHAVLTVCGWSKQSEVEEMVREKYAQNLADIVSHAIRLNSLSAAGGSGEVVGVIVEPGKMFDREQMVNDNDAPSGSSDGSKLRGDRPSEKEVVCTVSLGLKRVDISGAEVDQLLVKPKVVLNGALW